MKASPRNQRFERARAWSPGLVLVAGMALTVFTTYFAWRSIQLRTRARFDAAVQHTRAALETRLEAHLALLRGAAGLVSADTGVSASAFRTYVNRLQLTTNYPGIQGIGLSVRVPAADKDAFVEAVRAEGRPDFRIWPDQPRPEYHTIIFLEPLDRRNQAALGYDMFTEPVRRHAMEQARDHGQAVASGRVTLVQEIEGPKQPGFLIYVPVYRRGSIPGTVAERRDEFVGFVYSPLRAGDLFSSILYRERAEQVDIEIYAGPEARPEDLLFRSADRLPHEVPLHPALQDVSLLSFAGRDLRIRVTPSPEFAHGRFLAPVVLLLGTGLSLVLFYLSRAEAQALQVAETSERALRESREHLRRYADELEQRVAERTARLQESVQSLEGLLYHMAHDLRAPLRAMASFADILESEYRDVLDAKGLGYTKRITSAAIHMDRLVQDLLDYGRLAHMAVPLEPVKLEEHVGQALGRCAAIVNDSQAEVRVRRPMPAVLANPEVLDQVLAQLVTNAIQFVPPGTRPQIDIWADPGPFVRLWVRDNGIGIEPEYHARIFRAFERLRGKEGHPGTGIGLAIVQRGVERMGGRVGVESEPGSGSRFWIEMAVGGKS